MLGNSEISCGVKELFRFNEYNKPEDLLYKSICNALSWEINSPSGFAFILFSDTTRKRSGLTGAKFAKFIERKRLGTVFPSNIKTNPNSASKIRVWLWEVDRKALENWYKTKGAEV